MHIILKALPWAIAMLLLAIGEGYGLVASRNAQTMYVILPVLAIISIIGGSCIKRRSVAR